MLPLLVASLLCTDPAPALDLVPHDSPKKRTELLVELEQFDHARPSFTPGVVAMGFGLAALLVALVLEDGRYNQQIYSVDELYRYAYVVDDSRLPTRRSGVEIGFAVSGAVLTLLGSFWELHVGIDRWRSSTGRDDLVTAIETATR